jgi:outer membrane protein assembly factor BamB
MRFLLIALIFSFSTAFGQSPEWATKLDGQVKFYQMTDIGILIAGTEKSLYALDSERGDILWRLKRARFDETDVAPVPGTDLLLVNLEDGNRSRVAALDVASGKMAWQSEKVSGSVMQLAVDLDANLLAAVFVRKAKGRSDARLKKHPIIRVLNLSTGKELWDEELKGEVEMMPAHWNETGDVPFTLANYRPPLFLDGRLYLFYEGLTSYDARTGENRLREKFSINEEGLVLTDAEPIIDQEFIYLSGRGKVRSISRQSGKEVWEAKDLGVTPQMFLQNGILYVRTGGQFTRTRDGETVDKGPYGVSAIDARSGKVLWRYKGADKGISNLVQTRDGKIVIADKDDLIVIDPATGKRTAKYSHKIDRAGFVLLNEREQAVVGGHNEIAAFDLSTGQLAWRTRHTPPGRGWFKSVASIALRAAAIYFRYGAVAGYGLRGVQLARGVSSLRWSGLSAGTALPSLSTIASDSARNIVTNRFSTFGMASRVNRTQAVVTRPSIGSPVDVEDTLLDRLDPARQMERLSRFLWRKNRYATLRGNWMYFYTNLKTSDTHGLAGVNVNTGRTEVEIPLKQLDDRFIVIEATDTVYLSKENRMLADRVKRF